MVLLGKVPTLAKVPSMLLDELEVVTVWSEEPISLELLSGNAVVPVAAGPIETGSVELVRLLSVEPVKPVSVELVKPVSVEPVKPGVSVDPVKPGVSVESVKSVSVEPVKPVSVEPVKPLSVEPVNPEASVEPVQSSSGELIEADVEEEACSSSLKICIMYILENQNDDQPTAINTNCHHCQLCPG